MNDARPPKGRGSGNRGWSAQRPAQRARQGDSARTVAYQTIRAVHADDAYANLVLPRTLREQGVRGRDAALATELAYGTLRGLGTYDAVLARCVDRPLADLDPPVLDVLRLGAHQLLATRIPSHAAVGETVALARATVGAGASGLVNAVLRKVAARSLEDWLPEITEGLDENERLGVLHSHPAWVVRAFRVALRRAGRDGDLERLLAADNLSPQVSLVAHPGLLERVTLLEEVSEAGMTAREGHLTPWSVVLEGGDPGRLPAVRAKTARVQDEGSQVVAAAFALGATPTESSGPRRWLDMCAGPGGKTALTAALLDDAAGVALESVPHRADLVRSGLADAVKDRVDVRLADAREFVDPDGDESGWYDRVLVDVPCTGLGALRRRPEARWRRRPGDIAELGPLQRQLLTAALDAVRPGGLVVYATCSPHVAETVAVVEDVLRARPQASGVAAGDVVGHLPWARALVEPGTPSCAVLESAPHCLQLWPHVHGCDAMFLSFLTRT